MFSGLELTLFLLAAAVLGVVAFRMMQLPPMLGYLVVGIIIGPHGLAFAEDNETTHALAEFGVSNSAGWCLIHLDRLGADVRQADLAESLDIRQPSLVRTLDLLQAKSMLTRLPLALGPLEGHRLAIDVPVLTQVLGGLIRSGALVADTPASRILSARPLEAVA